MRIEFDYHHPTQGITQHWAVHLQFQCGKQILLPLSLQLTGPVANDYVTDTLYLQGWTYDHRAAICKAGSRDKRSRANFAIRSFYDKSISTFDKFQHSPVLHVADVEMLFTSEQCTGWRPRRYVATWSLFTSIIHIHGNHKRSMTPLYGRYTDIRLLIRKVYETGLEVEFLSNPIGKCFEVLKLSSFTLASSRVLSQRLQKLHTVMHSDVLAENPGYLSHFVSKALHLGWHLVDNEHRCRFLSCVEKVKGLSSDYCMYHSAEIIRSIETFPDHVAVNVPDLVDLGTPEVNQEEHRLAVLNEWFKQPSKTWLIDFEFVQLRGEQSPIPLQMSIRQLDGRPVLECNIDHNVTSEKFRGALAELSTSCKNLGYQTFERCYDDIETNGLTPPQIKEHLENIGYDKNTRVLSWSSSADMQCLLVLLRGRTGLVQDKISHTTAKNFQGINLRDLCRKLFPRLPNDTLSVVHRYLGVPSDQDVPPLIRAYHSASYDTYALAQIVARLKRL